MDIAQRFEQNPLLRPSDVTPSIPGMRVECLLNPGAFRFRDKTWLLLRVAERPEQTPGRASTPVLDPRVQDGLVILQFEHGDPDLDLSDARTIAYRGVTYLSTLSHLRLAESDDGIHFRVHERPTLLGVGPLETFGIEDCRVVELGDRFYLTYTAVSPSGVGVGMIGTADWAHFERHGMIIPPHNKDCALFPEKIGGFYYALHRPSGIHIGGNYIWISRSPDLHHWGDHRCLAQSRPGQWDSARVGAGASPIRTEEGWLCIYHGADGASRYCLGALLLDLADPTIVLSRSVEPIMAPTAPYEKTGFFGNVVFTNGHIVDGDRATVYYGASDEVICAADFSIAQILDSLRPTSTGSGEAWV